MIATRDERTLAVQLRDELATLIQHEALKPGDKMPSEAELTSRFRVSRPALREALKLLEQDGIIYVAHGRGRFVSAMAAIRVERPITVFESVTDMVRHSGYHPVNKLLSVTEQRAGAVVGPALRLPEEASVIRLERLRMQGEEALIYCDDYIPRMVIPGSASDVDWSGSLLDILGGQGSRPVMSSATVTSVTLPRDVAERNALANFGPALLITEVAFTHAGVPVIYAQDYHKGDAFSFRFLRK